MIRVWTDSNPTKVTIPTMASYQWSYSDVDKNSGRNDYGYMMRNRIASKIKLQLSWNAFQNPSEHERLVTILKGLPPFFYCEFVDGDGTTREMECYRGDISTSMYKYDPTNGTIWKETKVNFIQR